MADISNRTLTILIILSIFVSFYGILNASVHGTITITGAAVNTTSGTANITIQSVTQIFLSNNTVDFGTGFVNGTADSCTLKSNESTKTAACQGFNAPAQSSAFVIENIGTNNVSLDINGTFANPRAFLCNAAVASQNCTLANPEYNWSGDNLESGSCITQASDASAFGFGSSFVRILNSSIQRICSNMDFNTNQNSIQVKIRIVLPRDSKTGQLNDSVTFTGTG